MSEAAGNHLYTCCLEFYQMSFSWGKAMIPVGVFHLSSPPPPATHCTVSPETSPCPLHPPLSASHHYDLPSSPLSGLCFLWHGVSLSSGDNPDPLTTNQGLGTNNEDRLLKQLHMTRMGKRSLPGLPPWMVSSPSQAFTGSLVQVDSEPDTMFSDYQNYGTYGPNLPDQNYGMFGPNLPGFKKRNRVAFTFGLGK